MQRRITGAGGQRGFALLVTLTLLAFVLVLLVGLATYARIETAVAGNTQRQGQARQNALLALDAALAQLQRSAGPDQRVTATAENFGGQQGTRHYTGVWDAASTGVPPITWLVSGNENDPRAISPTAPATDWVELIGRNTSTASKDVIAPRVDIRASGVPGTASETTIGRYAWWIGDEGVKASLAARTRCDEVAYAPYDSAESRARLPQQFGSWPMPSTLDLDAAAMAELGGRVSQRAQFPLLPRSDGSPLGLDVPRQNFHAWTVNHRAVLSNTVVGGLRQDLSLQPELLGSAFAAWANYGSYMENPRAPAAPTPLPAYSDDPLRRRYRITPPVAADHAGVAPVLTYFYLLCGIRKQTGATPYTLTVRWAAALWNPFSSAMVPEDLRLEISGLPESLDFINANTSAVNASASLRQLYGEPLRVALPWIPATSPRRSEHQSWLPGRVYNWVNASGAPLQPGTVHPGRFNSRDLGGFADGLIATVPGTPVVNGSTPLSIRLNSEVTLTVRLVRARDGATLAMYTSPTYAAVASTAPDDANKFRSQLGFLFRLAESFDTVAHPSLWLMTARRDPRQPNFPADGLRAVPNGPNPAAYANYITIAAPDRLFDRDIMRGVSYNEDAPLFELPRAPILSLGMLQHFHLPGARPFAIGNSWGATARIHGLRANELFDRFYFSGLTPQVSATDTSPIPLPNGLLEVQRRDVAGRPVTLTELRSATDAKSAKHLLQNGAFNVNSTRADAWAAVLRAGRSVGESGFSYADASALSGSAADEARREDRSTGARFFRFSHSAQEVFKADDNYPQSLTSTTGSGPVINTPLFRRGLRTLDAEQLAAFAEAIAANVKHKHAATGPFRSLEEFLGPASALNDRSVIEKAIEDAGLNMTVAEFSSQWLTQGDVMTTLGPLLVARSDTFLIRAYGETVNPLTAHTEGRAWCEALVQRSPEYFEAAADPPEAAPTALSSELNRQCGRRFKIIFFRWLTRNDL